MNEEVYVTGYGYMTPEQVEEKLKETADKYGDQVRIIGQWTVHLEHAKQEAIELSIVLDNLMKAKMELEEHDDERPRG